MARFSTLAIKLSWLLSGGELWRPTALIRGFPWFLRSTPGECWSSTLINGPWNVHNLSFLFLVLVSPLVYTLTRTTLPHVGSLEREISHKLLGRSVLDLTVQGWGEGEDCHLLQLNIHYIHRTDYLSS